MSPAFVNPKKKNLSCDIHKHYLLFHSLANSLLASHEFRHCESISIAYFYIMEPGFDFNVVVFNTPVGRVCYFTPGSALNGIGFA